MRTNTWNLCGSGSKVFTRTTVALLAGVLFSSAVRAEPTTIVAAENPAVTSSFSLDFGLYGGVASARIASTDISFEVDPDLGTARFVEYYQQVAPLTLPGGISTGPLIIEIVDGSSVGTYDELTGEFNTEEIYAISFEADLSAFGFESPVLFPSTSNGFVTVNADIGGEINLAWAGSGELGNPADPTGVIPFEYTCNVATTFAAEAVDLVRLALLPQVLNLDLRPGVEDNLTAKLMAAVDALRRGNDRAASRMLNAFARTVSALSGRRIDAADAEDLIGTADAVITMLGGTISVRVQMFPTSEKNQGVRRAGSR